MPTGVGAEIKLPHEIYGAVPVYTVYWLILAGVLFLVLGALAIWYFRKRKHESKKDTAAAVDPWSELEVKLSGLDVTVGDIPELFFQLSLILREGIALATTIPAAKLTIKELTPKLLTAKSLAPDLSDKILKILAEADLVKFADKPASYADAAQLQKEVELILKALRSEGSYAPS